VLGTILAAKEAAKHFGPDGGSIISRRWPASRRFRQRQSTRPPRVRSTR
jgi:hypothetical protein